MATIDRNLEDKLVSNTFAVCELRRKLNISDDEYVKNRIDECTGIIRTFSEARLELQQFDGYRLTIDELRVLNGSIVMCNGILTRMIQGTDREIELLKIIEQRTENNS